MKHFKSSNTLYSARLSINLVGSHTPVLTKRFIFVIGAFYGLMSPDALIAVAQDGGISQLDNYLQAYTDNNRAIMGFIADRKPELLMHTMNVITERKDGDASITMPDPRPVVECERGRYYIYFRDFSDELSKSQPGNPVTKSFKINIDDGGLCFYGYKGSTYSSTEQAKPTDSLIFYKVTINNRNYAASDIVCEHHTQCYRPVPGKYRDCALKILDMYFKERKEERPVMYSPDDFHDGRFALSKLFNLKYVKNTLPESLYIQGQY